MAILSLLRTVDFTCNPMERRETTSVVVISLFDEYFKLVTQHSMPGEVVATQSGVTILEMTRTLLREFINDRLQERGYRKISQNSRPWTSLLQSRIQESDDLLVDLTIGDGRHSMASNRISGKSQQLKLMFNPNGIRD